MPYSFKNIYLIWFGLQRIRIFFPFFTKSLVYVSGDGGVFMNSNWP